MDAHLFRRVCTQLAPLLQFSRIDHIAALAPHVVQCKLYGTTGKITLIIHISRDKPCLMLVPQALSPKAFGQATPSAPIMRLRKYTLKRRIMRVTCAWLTRCIHLHLGGDTPCVLSIDMSRGIYLQDTLPENEPFESIVWPTSKDLQSLSLDSPQDHHELWRTYPILTPALRRTLILLEPLEQEALLLDLQDGNGDVFAVYDEHGVCDVHAWPLPKALCKERTEKTFEDVFEALLAFGKRTILDVLATNMHREERKQAQTSKSRLQRLIKCLDRDYERLKGMQAQQETALHLQTWLHSLPAHHKMSELVVPGYDPLEKDHIISLNPALTVRENMQAMFHTAARGKRGLKYVADRRQNVLSALAELELGTPHKTQYSVFPPKKPMESGDKTHRTPQDKTASIRSIISQKTARTKVFPKNIQVFISKDGFTIWRGRDAKGNMAILRHAAPHDLWMHIEGGTGAHVVIRRDHPQHEIPEPTLHEAAYLCAAKSWCAHVQGALDISVMTAFVRHIHPKRGLSGMVDIQCLQGTIRLTK